MASIRTWKSIEKATLMGAYAGHPDALPLWELSRRELVEIALRLGEIAADEPSVEAAIARVKDERNTLREQGLI